MLRAFLVVWTLVAGLAAASLLYMVGLRPQTGAIATAPQATSASGALGEASSVKRDINSGAVANRTAPDEFPATTGAISVAPRTAAESSSSTGSQAAVKPPSEQPAAEAAVMLPPTRPAELSSLTTAEADAAASRPARAPERPGVRQRSANAGPASSPADLPDEEEATRDPRLPMPGSNPSVSREPAVRSAAAPAPAAQPESRPSREAKPTASDAAPARRREAALAREPAEVTAVEREPRDRSKRTLKERARAAKLEASRVRESARPAPAVERPARVTLRAKRELRRQAQKAEPIRVARGDGRLERLYDEFNRSGVDYLRERTYRVGGGGYVVERTTPYGTTYFYESSGRR